ncbi:hypothetical protein FRC03_001368 [Tulasnella sp. 419]|nr:hypothetical protein FRC03_001368 [Tulasnella sp. 419]
MRYLLDELQEYEEDYSSALDHDRLKEDRSFLGEHLEMRPVTATQLGEVVQGLEEKILQKVKVAVAQEIEAKMGDFDRLLKQRLQEGISNIVEAVTSELTSSARLPQNNPLASGTSSVTNAIHPNPPASDVNATPSTPVVVSDPGSQHPNNITITPSTSHPSSATQHLQRMVIMSIPDLVEKEGRPMWRCIVSDWENADPERGLD